MAPAPPPAAGPGILRPGERLAHPEIVARDGTALLVIDVQERIDAVMAGGHHRPRLEVLVDAFRALGLPVVATEQYPRGLGATVGWLAGRLPEAPLEKATFSCAREDAVREALAATRAHRIVVTGIEAHVCVVQTVLDLLHEGFQVQVPHDAVNSRRFRDREWALHRMAQAGAVVTSTESVLFELVERCATEEFRRVAALVKRLPVEPD